MKVDEARALNIKSWSLEDRPREKLMMKGSSSLSDAELIAILIGSGTAACSAVEVARKLMAASSNDLHQLAKRSVTELTKTKGIGEAKAITIVAALELGRRRRERDPAARPGVSGSRDAFEIIRSDLMDLTHEEFWVILLNRANRFIRKKKVSAGGVSGTVADPKIIFKLALEELACGIIVVHNHPSGNLTASQSDIDLTRRLKEAGKLLEVQLLDHLIIAGEKYHSFADEGML